MEWLQQWDSSVLFFIQQHVRSDFLDPLMTAITSLGDIGFIWLIGAALLLVQKKYRKHGLLLLGVLLLCLLVGNFGLKNLIGRTRPCIAYPGTPLLIPVPSGSSFPSAHSMTSFAAAGVLFAANRRYGVAAFAVAAAIAFSRLYLFVHYPSDVLAGMLIGLGIAAICVFASRRLYPHFRKRLVGQRAKTE
jgi:undecaprenyl-diphosphatase